MDEHVAGHPLRVTISARISRPASSRDRASLRRTLSLRTISQGVAIAPVRAAMLTVCPK